MFFVDDVECANQPVGSTHPSEYCETQRNGECQPGHSGIRRDDAAQLIFDDRRRFARDQLNDGPHLSLDGFDVPNQSIDHYGRGNERRERKEGEKSHTSAQKRQIVKSPHSPHTPKNLFPSSFWHLQRAFCSCAGSVFR